jgi:hypothetical protein
VNDNAIKGLLVAVSLVLLALCALFSARLFGLHGALVCVTAVIIGFFALAMLGDAVQRAQHGLPSNT